MATKFESSESILKGLKQDMLWLLITIYSYQERSSLKEINQWSRRHFGIELVLLESAVRDIISRLTALDDNTKNNRSFQTLFSALKRENLEMDRAKSLKSKVKAYRQAINTLKVLHRNSYIAHVGTSSNVAPRVVDNPINFEDAASKAVNLLDDFEGQQIPYFFRIGSDLKIDLRAALQAGDENGLQY